MSSNNRFITPLSIGLLLHPFLPGLGFQDLMQQTFTRILFATELNTLIGSTIASYSALIVAVLIFIWILKRFQVLNDQELKLHWQIAFISFICFYALWFSYPYITDSFNNYWIKGFKELSEHHDLYTYGIIYPARFIGLIIGLIIIRKKVISFGVRS